eukprot:gnl/TRDRNA2_/TRDRNA2_189324_c0_seq1.p1 gnl/TRDRNA2_/TRDRNA2_189324_c0~~gnl/TRDRNA2_/TRDRNA2_189324_c0_seq1.p1  ORF type:complete len:974 (-),score=233.01 gnl/TRDRNA2_/TRDRNA2_189324_c0_seq1:141-2972(-)
MSFRTSLFSAQTQMMYQSMANMGFGLQTKAPSTPELAGTADSVPSPPALKAAVPEPAVEPEHDLAFFNAVFETESPEKLPTSRSQQAGAVVLPEKVADGTSTDEKLPVATASAQKVPAGLDVASEPATVAEPAALPDSAVVPERAEASAEKPTAAAAGSATEGAAAGVGGAAEATTEPIAVEQSTALEPATAASAEAGTAVTAATAPSAADATAVEPATSSEPQVATEAPEKSSVPDLPAVAAKASDVNMKVPDSEMRMHVKSLIAGMDLQNITLGVLREKIEKRLGLAPGTSDQQAVYNAYVAVAPAAPSAAPESPVRRGKKRGGAAAKEKPPSTPAKSSKDMGATKATKKRSEGGTAERMRAARKAAKQATKESGDQPEKKAKKAKSVVVIDSGNGDSRAERKAAKKALKAGLSKAEWKAKKAERKAAKKAAKAAKKAAKEANSSVALPLEEQTATPSKLDRSEASPAETAGAFRLHTPPKDQDAGRRSMAADESAAEPKVELPLINMNIEDEGQRIYAGLLMALFKELGAYTEQESGILDVNKQLSVYYHASRLFEFRSEVVAALRGEVARLASLPAAYQRSVTAVRAQLQATSWPAAEVLKGKRIFGHEHTVRTFAPQHVPQGAHGVSVYLRDRPSCVPADQNKKKTPSWFRDVFKFRCVGSALSNIEDSGLGIVISIESQTPRSWIVISPTLAADNEIFTQASTKLRPEVEKAQKEKLLTLIASESKDWASFIERNSSAISKASLKVLQQALDTAGSSQGASGTRSPMKRQAAEAVEEVSEMPPAKRAASEQQQCSDELAAMRKELSQVENRLAAARAEAARRDLDLQLAREQALDLTEIDRLARATVGSRQQGLSDDQGAASNALDALRKEFEQQLREKDAAHRAELRSTREAQAKAMRTLVDKFLVDTRAALDRAGVVMMEAVADVARGTLTTDLD